MLRYLKYHYSEDESLSAITIEESFLGFYEMDGQGAKDMEKQVLELFSTLGINIAKLSGMGFDGAAAMSVIYL